MTDPIADMLTRVRNAASRRQRTVTMPSSSLKLSIAEVLKREGYIEAFSILEKKIQNHLQLKLKYGPEGEQVIRTIARVSTPGRRIYREAGRLPRVLNGLGIAIVSTNKGVLSDRECRRQKVGGEVLCTVE